MGSVVDALQGVFGGGQDVSFLNEVLRQYREIRKVYHYQYTAEDKQALKACATDLRPFTHSFVPAGGTYWVLSKMVKHPQQLGRLTRAALVLLRLAAASEVFRVGYLVGSYRQGMDCTRRLVELRSPLGGEIVAIIRSRDPQHPLLKYERQPAEMNEDGSRPRIVNEANRLAQIAHFQKELAAAKGGQPLAASDHYNRSADDFLFQIMKQREQDVSTIQQGGGPAAAIASGRPEAVRPEGSRSPRAEYEAAGMASATGISAAMGGGSLSTIRRDGGLVITDEPQAASPQSSAALQQQAAQLAAAAVGGGVSNTAPGGSSTGGSSGAEATSGGDDPFGMLLGGGLGGAWGAELSEEGAARAAAEEARHRRREAWKKRWWRRGGRGEEQQSW
ncbi:hypothetical protein C2E21_7966 [Chlorella sorokiniana]|uniref:Uncharacterized protein n=1 Tax=Chlorella sorokiniana TaxID=3076 RepID=A0A2P6TFD9_CHLSO|nr:hypothetical protein C2E21_7966 [Chlorella sorokiniana]|eukprot:PRW32831.1 hypothetical protein C2E21_7966 [Chlorella sorokiniana]